MKYRVGCVSYAHKCVYQRTYQNMYQKATQLTFMKDGPNEL